MNRFIASLLSVLVAAGAFAQVGVRGTVVDLESGAPLAGASVVVKGADSKIRKFASTKADGIFSFELAAIDGCRIEVSKMSYAKQTLPLDSVSFPLTIYMEAGAIELREVAVKSRRIREQGDTISYNVGSFAQTQDRSIGDVLKRMPGIDVSKNGRIKYQGEDINKFYIEGSDMLGGKYGIATNGINHDDVGAVEVMENHQPLQVLSGIAFSDKAAINLKLKGKAKATWNFHGNAGGGWSWQPEGAVWDGEMFAMAVMPSFQHITMLRTNNTGEDLSASYADFFAGRRGTGLSRNVGVSLPPAAGLSGKRTLFNRSFMLTSNNLWKMRHGEFKANIDYSFNRLAADASNVTTYFLDDGNRIITENSSGKEHEHSLGGKFIYELNNRTAYINNTLKTNIDWNNTDLRTTGTLPNTQSADMPDYYVANDLRMIRRFGGKHLVTFESSNEWESLPQTLRVSGDKDTGSFRQCVADHSFFTRESASYAFTLKGLTVSIEGGFKGYWRSMNSELPELPDELPGITTNTVSTNSMTVFAKPKVEYWFRRVDITLNLPVSFAHYSFHNAIANRDEVYFAPSLSLDWKPNNRFSTTLRAGTGRAPMNLSLINQRSRRTLVFFRL